MANRKNVPADDTRRILGYWQDKGYSFKHMAIASGVSESNLRYTFHQADHVNAKTAEAVSRLTEHQLEAVIASRKKVVRANHVPTDEAVARIREFMDMGYSIPVIADALGTKRKTLENWIYGSTKNMYRTYHLAVMRLDKRRLDICAAGHARPIVPTAKPKGDQRILGYEDSPCPPHVYHELMPRPDGNQWIVWQRMEAKGDPAKWGKWSKTETEAIDAWNEMVISDGRKFDLQKHIDDHNARISKNMKFNDLPTYEFTQDQIRKYINCNSAY